jgi:xanthine/uracil permease
MLGIVVGMVGGLASGLTSTASMDSFFNASMAAIPEPHYLAYDLRFSLIQAFLVAGCAVMLRAPWGVITTYQKINDVDWKRPSSSRSMAASLPMVLAAWSAACWASSTERSTAACA